MEGTVAGGPYFAGALADKAAAGGPVVEGGAIAGVGVIFPAGWTKRTRPAAPILLASVLGRAVRMDRRPVKRRQTAARAARAAGSRVS